MKKALLALTIVAIFSGHAVAVDMFWDRDDNNIGGSAGTTANGAWDLVTANWNLNSDGSGANTTWVTTNVGVFSAGGDVTGASTITGSATAAGLTIQEGTVEFTGTITLAANPITVESGAVLVQNSSLRLSTTGASVYTLNSGTIRSTNPGAAGSFIDVDSDIVLNGASGLDHTVAGILNIIQATTIISGPGSWAKGGAGVLAIASPATHAGGTIVNAGELRIRTSNDRLPVTGAVTVNSGGILNLNNLSQRIGTLTGTGRVGLGNGTLTLESGSNSTYDGTIEDTANAGAGGSASVGGKLIKAGAGIQTLTGANIYTGVTNINGGTLLANNASGSATGSAGVTVGAAGTLGGTGSVSGAVTVNGTLAPGASIESLGTGAVTFNTGSTFSYEMNTGAPLISAGDLLDATGALSIGTGVTLSLFQLGAGVLPAGQKLTLISYNATWNSGTFAGFADDSWFNFGGNQWIINYDDASPGGNFLPDTAGALAFVTLTAVPEASALLTMGLGFIFTIAAVWVGKRLGVNALKV